jgi:CO/xanthine dehydrogenase Mo-binding subunit
MTEMLNKEFSRKTFLKGGGAMIVGFSLAGSLVGPGKAAAAGDRLNPREYMSVTRDLGQVDSYIVIHPDNTASIMVGGVDVGGGSGTGWLMIAAEELDMDVNQLRFVWPDTAVTPHPQLQTASSTGMKNMGPQVRSAAAYGKQHLLKLASASVGVPVGSLTVKSGVVSGGGRSVTYGELIGDKLFNVTMPVKPVYFGSFSGPPGPDGFPRKPTPNLTAAYLQQHESPAKPISQYTIVGTRVVPRIDIPDIASGRLTYAQNVRVPGMVHGRVVRPRGQAAYGSGAKPLSIDESSIKHIDAQIVRKGDFLAVVAANEYAAIQAAAQIKVKWADPSVPLSGSGNLWRQMRADDARGMAPARDGSIGAQYGERFGPVGNVDAALKSAANTVSATYSYAYQMHGPIGPQVAIADVRADGALILTYNQGPSGLVADVAQVLGLPEERVRVKVFPGSSFHGGGGNQENPAPAAAVMSQIVGKPVRLQYMRWDEHGWDTFGATHLVDMRGGVDAKGNITAWEYTSFALPYVSGGTPSELILGGPYPPPGLGAVETSADGVQYELPNWRVLWKTLPLYDGYFKTAYMRASHSAQTAFATETFADELAYAARMDPVEFRRQNVRKTQPRGFDLAGFEVNFSYRDRFLAVLNAAAMASNWQPRVAASNLSDATVVTGRGVAFGPRTWKPTFSALVAEIEVNKKTGKITVKHLYAAQDSGLTVNPALVENQIVGQVTMNTSRALLEEVRFDTKRQTSLDWVSYPILRFKDAPKVTPIVIQRPEIEMAGAGDHVMEHVPAAIANAFFDATGVRIRQVPMTPAAVRAALAAKGGGTAGVK